MSIAHWKGFMLPEHRADMNKRREEAKKVEKPVLDEQEKEIIDAKLLMAEISHLRIRITYFKDGKIQQAKGRIKEVNRYWKWVILRNEEETEVRIENLIDVFIL